MMRPKSSGLFLKPLKGANTRNSRLNGRRPSKQRRPYYKLRPRAFSRVTNQMMNKNNFMDHEYFTLHNAIKGDDGKYSKITLKITRDFIWPLGQEVKDLDEFKYACQVNDFDFNSLRFEDNEFVIKENSPEWFNYINDPGVSYEEYMDTIHSYILDTCFEQGLTITPIYNNNLKNTQP